MAQKPDDGGAPAKIPPEKQPVAPPPPAGVSQAAIDASIAANPQASKGGYEGVGTPDKPGPGGTTNYGNPTVSQSATSDPSQNWAQAFFGSLGLPDDVMNQVVSILRDHAQDQNLAQALATQYIRSTSWYAVHYPGALEGIAKGVISSEADYAKYVNQLNVLSQQYNGRAISGDEVKGYLQNGYDVNYVSKLFGGQAWVAANSGQTRYALSNYGVGTDGAPPTDLTALGNENAGIDTALGQTLQNRLQQAVNRMKTIAQGTLATPSLSLGSNGLQAPSLAGSKQAPDVAA